MYNYILYRTDKLNLVILIVDDHGNAQEWINNVDGRPIGEWIYM